MSPVSPVYGSSIEESHTLPFPRMLEMRVVFWARQTMALHLRTKISPNLADPMAEVVVDAVQCPEKMILYSHEKEVASDLMAFLKGVVFFGFGSGAFGEGKAQNIENQTHKSSTS